VVRRKKVRFDEPHGRKGRPFNPWISRWPLLGPITLASILDERGFDVAVYSENLSGAVVDNPQAYADLCSADVVGISIMTPTAARGYAIADRLKRDAPNVKIVFGGVHATFMAEEALSHGDIVVCGEGETVIEQIASGEIDSGIIHAPPLADLDSIPTLNHFLMRDFEKLAGKWRGAYELPVMASRGCPHGCTYCCVTRMFGRKVRRQSVEKVYRDLCRYAERGFRHLFFYDDNFTSDRKWTTALLERLRPMRMRFNAQARADFAWADTSRHHADTSLLRAMRRAGGDVLYIGYETIDEATARRWKKGYTGGNSLAARLRQDTRVLHDNGFWIHAMFVLGPEHTQATARQIVDFARYNAIETIQISILTPLPGTPLMEEMRPHLVFRDFPADWDYYDGTHVVYNHGRLPAKLLQKVVLDAHRRFYRWGGWSARRVRGLLEGQGSVSSKVARMLFHARVAGQALREWRKEMETFLHVFEAKNRTLLSTGT